MIMHNTASCLIEIRKSKKLSQNEFAKSLGVSLRSYQYYESGARPIPIEVLQGLAEIGANVHWLLTGEGEMFLEDEGNVEQQRLSAKYWQKNHETLEAAVKLAYRRLADRDGEERAKEIFVETRGFTDRA